MIPDQVLEVDVFEIKMRVAWSQYLEDGTPESLERYRRFKYQYDTNCHQSSECIQIS